MFAPFWVAFSRSHHPGQAWARAEACYSAAEAEAAAASDAERAKGLPLVLTNRAAVREAQHRIPGRRESCELAVQVLVPVVP